MFKRLTLIVVGVLVLGGCELLKKSQMEELPVKGGVVDDGGGMVEGKKFNQGENGLEEVVENEEESMGKIRGPLSYPSEGIPEDLMVCAEEVEGDEEFCTNIQIESEEFDNGVGFELSVPEGSYYVYAVLPGNLEQRAYFNEFVTCGLKFECESHEKIEVEVEVGEVVYDVMPHDWYDVGE